MVRERHAETPRTATAVVMTRMLSKCLWLNIRDSPTPCRGSAVVNTDREV
jgi:hypothetical protein